MASSDYHEIVSDIVIQFEALAMRIELVIESLAHEESGSIDLSALHRAKDAARRAASHASNATSGVRRAFD